MAVIVACSFGCHGIVCHCFLVERSPVCYQIIIQYTTGNLPCYRQQQQQQSSQQQQHKQQQQQQQCRNSEWTTTRFFLSPLTWRYSRRHLGSMSKIIQLARPYATMIRAIITAGRGAGLMLTTLCWAGTTTAMQEGGSSKKGNYTT